MHCNNSGRSYIFVNHVTKIAEYVSSSYGVKTIIWDDMLRNLVIEEQVPLSIIPILYLILLIITAYIHNNHPLATIAYLPPLYSNVIIITPTYDVKIIKV